jgi:hypothetical protein
MKYERAIGYEGTGANERAIRVEGATIGSEPIAHESTMQPERAMIPERTMT